MLYAFLGRALVCDEFFVPSLNLLWSKAQRSNTDHSRLNYLVISLIGRNYKKESERFANVSKRGKMPMY